MPDTRPELSTAGTHGAAARAWLEQPAQLLRPPPEAQVFELGLSLGGTVSAGAYTAGVLDFLVEAMDEWERTRREAPDTLAPQQRHRLRLQVVSGTSGGAVCATLLARALAFELPPAPQAGGSAASDAAVNPFHQLWVRAIDFSSLSAVDEPRRGQPLEALLDARPLMQACDWIAEDPQRSGLAPRRRDWVAEPLSALLTLTNLTGVPYRVGYQPNCTADDTLCTWRHAQSYRRHADYVRFEYFYSEAPAQAASWPDAFVVQAHPQARTPRLHGGGGPAQSLDWPGVSAFARASAAFPGGFPAVSLQRPAWHYLYQPLMLGQPQPDGRSMKLTPRTLEPDWESWGQDPGAPYSFACVDGGVLDNEPLELARRHLAGLAGRNPREPHRAQRAVIHVDPFCETPGPGPRAPHLLQGLGGTVQALIGHARFSTQDFHAATDPEVRSRFLVTAVRESAEGTRYGNEALACAPLGAFGGFLAEAYRAHDFQLGRRNCQRFLQQYFTLSCANPLFATEDRTDSAEWPVIPLLGSAARTVPAPDWPIDALPLQHPDADASRQLADALDRRLDFAIDSVRSRLSLLPRTLLALVRGALRRRLREGALDRVRKALRQNGLLR